MVPVERQFSYFCHDSNLFKVNISYTKLLVISAQFEIYASLFDNNFKNLDIIIHLLRKINYLLSKHHAANADCGVRNISYRSLFSP